MKRHTNRVMSLLLAAALCASLLVPASAAEAGVTVWNDTIGGHTANLVSVSMTEGRTGEIALANNSVVESAPVKDIIAAAEAKEGTHVVAAINGGFFNSYTTGEPVFPASCPMILNAVVKDGKLIHTGNTATLGFTADGKAMIDWVTLGAKVKLGNGFTPGCWSVNTYENDPGAIMLFDQHLTLPVTIPTTSTMYYIENGVISKALPGGVLNVPAGVQVLVYNAAITEIERGYHRLPEVGMTAEVQMTASGTDRDEAWANVQDALVGGRLLVKGGVNVAADSRNSAYDGGDGKQTATSVLARSFVGVTGSGALILGTVTASFNQIADWMVKNGVQEGLAMDGGASSMLYADGAYVTPAGRPLASVLTIVDKSGQPAAPSTPKVDPNVPSPWFAEEIPAAISAGLVPEDLQKDYPTNINRQDFCRLIWELVKKQPDYVQLLWNKDPVTFTDTFSAEVSWCAQLGLISGVGEGRFDPYSSLTRAQAAKILALTVQLLGGSPDTKQQAGFSDRDAFPFWDEGWIDYCGVNQIMNGEDGGAFNPDGTFTREQAMATILRIHQRFSK